MHPMRRLLPVFMFAACAADDLDHFEGCLPDAPEICLACSSDVCRICDDLTCEVVPLEPEGTSDGHVCLGSYCAGCTGVEGVGFTCTLSGPKHWCGVGCLEGSDCTWTCH